MMLTFVTWRLMVFQVWTRAERQAAATGRGVPCGRRFQQFPWRKQWGRFRFQFRRRWRWRGRRFLDQRGCVSDGGVHGYQVRSEGSCDWAYAGRASPYHTVLRATTSSTQVSLSWVSSLITKRSYMSCLEILLEEKERNKIYDIYVQMSWPP